MNELGHAAASYRLAKNPTTGIHAKKVTTLQTECIALAFFKGATPGSLGISRDPNSDMIPESSVV